MRNGEKGQALPLAIAALAIGAMVITPFIAHAGSSLIGSRNYAAIIAERSAADAGVEHAIWSLVKGGLADLLPDPGDQVEYPLDETLNGLPVEVTVTANVTVSGGTAGEITAAIIDTLEFDTSNGSEPDIIHIAGDIFAVAYRGAGNDGFVTTFSISDTGDISNTPIDSLEFDTSSGYEPDITRVSGDIYAAAYRGAGSDGFVTTFSISGTGDIGNAPIDSLEFDTSSGFEPDIVHASGDIFAVAYRGAGNDGFVTTFSISDTGDISNTPIDSLEFDPGDGYHPIIIGITSDVYAIAYQGPGDDGFVITVSIAASGDIGGFPIDTLEFDPANGFEPHIIPVSGDVYAIVYRGAGNGGFITTLAIAADGSIGNSIIATQDLATYSYEPSIVPVAGSVYAVAYRGAANSGEVRTVSISPDGSITNPLIDALVFDSLGYEPAIIHVSGDIYAVAYRGVGNDGYVTTIGINSQGDGGGAAAYLITSTAGDTVISAFVNISAPTVTIVSWQLQ